MLASLADKTPVDVDALIRTYNSADTSDWAAHLDDDVDLSAADLSSDADAAGGAAIPTDSATRRCTVATDNAEFIDLYRDILTDTHDADETSMARWQNEADRVAADEDAWLVSVMEEAMVRPSPQRHNVDDAEFVGLYRDMLADWDDAAVMVEDHWQGEADRFHAENDSWISFALENLLDDSFSTFGDDASIMSDRTSEIVELRTALATEDDGKGAFAVPCNLDFLYEEVAEYNLSERIRL